MIQRSEKERKVGWLRQSSFFAHYLTLIPPSPSLWCGLCYLRNVFLRISPPPTS
jgi:hypothetical protein